MEIVHYNKCSGLT